MLLPEVLTGTFWKSDWMAPHTPKHFIQAPYSRGWVFVDTASWAAGQEAGRETRGPGPPAASLVQRRGTGPCSLGCWQRFPRAMATFPSLTTAQPRDPPRLPSSAGH